LAAKRVSLSAATSAAILIGIANKLRIRCIYFLYRLILYLAVPVLPFYFALRIRRDRRYGLGFRERLGAIPFTIHPTPAGAIWLHAVSVGEVLSAIPLVQALRELYPLAPIFLSSTTVAGRELAKHKLEFLVDGIFFAPLDYSSCVRRVLKQLRPALVVILETEIWPNLWREAKSSGACLVIVNGRISDRSLPRYRSLSWFFRAALQQPDAILVQSAQDLDRYIQAGAPAERLSIGGNLKYDFTPAAHTSPDIADFLDRTHPECIWIAASTMPPSEPGDVDEDDTVIAAFNELAPHRKGLLLIHVPRRPERFNVAASKLETAGIHFIRRSRLSPESTLALPGVLLLDSIGELSGLFSRASVVFMGGTLARRGGHNILEPAYFGSPVITGPHMENFVAIAREFAAGEAIENINSPAGLAPAVDRILSDSNHAWTLGERARRIASEKRGAAGQIAQLLLGYYDKGLPQRAGSSLAAPLSALWKAGLRWDRNRGKPQPLPRAVISIGNVTVGGSGKTPLVQWFASRVSTGGSFPAILTRGYRRRSLERNVVLAAGTACGVSHTGDEAQIFLRRGGIHLGIGPDRRDNGNLIDREFGASLFLLDDGFQHWPLLRDLDIVAVDALDPFGGGCVIPRGRLREPLEGLSRAHAFVITRCIPGLRTAAIETVIRRYNPHAPIFKSFVRPVEWVDVRSGRRLPVAPIPFNRVAAFCGLGNPAGFWRTLEECGLEIAFRWSFPDHHAYRTFQLARLVRQAVSAQAQALVTTEKDFMNFPFDISRVPTDLPVYWLEIATEIENETALLDLAREVLERRTPSRNPTP
jgi:tetraacyldisaccharide 4'-kinase